MQVFWEFYAFFKSRYDSNLSKSKWPGISVSVIFNHHSYSVNHWSLPVIKAASRWGIAQRCIKNGKQWRHFKTLKLTANLRLKQDNEQAFQNYDTWTLRISDGPENTVDVTKENLWKINSSPLQVQNKKLFGNNIYRFKWKFYESWLDERPCHSYTNKQRSRYVQWACCLKNLKFY